MSTMQEQVDAMLDRSRKRMARFAEDQRLRLEEFEREQQEALDAFSAGRFPEYMQAKAAAATERRKRDYSETMGIPDAEQSDASAGGGGAGGGGNAGPDDDGEDGGGS